jgi:TM2 domain-containing membrane protein YozV
MLTSEDKQRIEEEERYRAEIRESLRTKAEVGPIVVERKPSNGVAAVLGLFIPGAGQMYKGKTGAGLCWLFGTVLGYCLFIFPGLILHLICVFDAAQDNPRPIDKTAAEMLRKASDTLGGTR